MSDMIQDTMSKFDQLYNGFINMPTEYQVVASVGGLVILAALKNIWGMLYPVRLAAASLLRSVAYVLHPRPRKKKVVDTRVPRRGVFDDGEKHSPPPFDVTTKEKFIATIKHYANKKSVSSLSTKQVQLLYDTAGTYDYARGGYNGTDGLIKPLIQDVRRRNTEDDSRKTAQEAAKLQERSEVPFHASEDDVV